MTKIAELDTEVLKKASELVGSPETALDLWNIFEFLMLDFDDNYDQYDSKYVNYLYMIFVFGYIQGSAEAPRLLYKQDHTKGLH